MLSSVGFSGYARGRLRNSRALNAPVQIFFGVDASLTLFGQVHTGGWGIASIPFGVPAVGMVLVAVFAICRGKWKAEKIGRLAIVLTITNAAICVLSQKFAMGMWDDLLFLAIGAVSSVMLVKDVLNDPDEGRLGCWLWFAIADGLDVGATCMSGSMSLSVIAFPGLELITSCTILAALAAREATRCIGKRRSIERPDVAA